MPYIPAFHGQLTSGDPHGGVNCTAWAEAFAIDYATRGKTTTTGTRVRALSNEPVPDKDSPGLNLAQVDVVGTQHFASPLDVHYGMKIAEARERINDLQEAAHLQVYYGPIADTRYDAGRGFRKNHDLLWLPEEILMDPLADGRVPGVYKFKGEKYPLSLIQSAAGALNISRDPRLYKALGSGLVYVAFTGKPPAPAIWRVSVHPLPGQKIRQFNTFVVRDHVIIGKPGLARTGGFSAACTPPQRVLWPGHSSQLLVQIKDGYRDKQWISARYASEVK